MLENGAFVDGKTETRNGNEDEAETPLYLAVKHEAKDVVFPLIKAGADISKLVRLSTEKADMLLWVLSKLKFDPKQTRTVYVLNLCIAKSRCCLMNVRYQDPSSERTTFA